MKRLALAALAFALPVFAAAPRNAPPPEQKVSVTTRTFTPEKNHPDLHRNWRGAVRHELRCTIWYPTTNQTVETELTLGPPDAPLFIMGRAAKAQPLATDGAAAKGQPDKRPLIVLSHGTGGSADQLAWLGLALARQGMIAVAVDHPGNNGNAPYTAEGFVLWWERATDISEVIDGMLADEDFGPHIDRRSIGAAGFSLGGYTVLELAGARTDQQLFFNQCQDPQPPVACNVPEMKNLATPGTNFLQQVRKTSRASIASQGENFRDERIRAVFAIAPAVSVAQTADSLRNIRIPVELVVGAADPIAPPATNADYLRANIHGSREITLPGGVAHYTFLDTCTARGKEIVLPYCTDNPGVDREAIHAQVSNLALDFFGKTLHWK